jgi:hypothetical protein
MWRRELNRLRLLVDPYGKQDGLSMLVKYGVPIRTDGSSSYLWSLTVA